VLKSSLHAQPPAEIDVSDDNKGRYLNKGNSIEIVNYNGIIVLILVSGVSNTTCCFSHWLR